VEFVDEGGSQTFKDLMQTVAMCNQPSIFNEIVHYGTINHCSYVIVETIVDG
jgi:hypothetical protein